ncbi:MAG: hypothetical protein Q9227_001673 [Pyrenula ochraceoflavens]
MAYFIDLIRRFFPGRTPASIFPTKSVEAFDPVLHQAASPLFNLPLEVREQIYQLFFGTTLIHFFNYGGRPRSFACHNDPCCKCEWKCIVLPPVKDHNDDLMVGILALPLTCRRIYLETMDLVYTTSVFHVFDPDLRYNDIPRLFAPDRLHSIRSLRISLKMVSPPLCYAYQKVKELAPSTSTSHSRTAQEIKQNHDSRYCLSKPDLAWINTFKSIGTMQGLREIYVEVVLGRFWSSSWKHDQGLIFRPLLEYVTRPESLVLRCDADVLPLGPYTEVLDGDKAREMSKGGLELLVDEWERKNGVVEIDGEVMYWINH